jgi:hypothetical protein
MLSIALKNVKVHNLIRYADCIILLYAIILSNIVLSVNLRNFIMLNVLMLIIIKLNVVMLSVNGVSLAAPSSALRLLNTVRDSNYCLTLFRGSSPMTNLINIFSNLQ